MDHHQIDKHPESTQWPNILNRLLSLSLWPLNLNSVQRYEQGRRAPQLTLRARPGASIIHVFSLVHLYHQMFPEEILFYRCNIEQAHAMPHK